MGLKSKLLDAGLDAARKRGRLQGFDMDETFYHGSTHNDIMDLDASGTNPESDWGRGLYATTEPADASANYAGIGPDLRSRIDQSAERMIDDEWEIDALLDEMNLEQDAWDNMDWDEQLEHTKQRAQQGLVGDTPDGVIYPMHVNKEKFAQIGGDNPTQLEGTDYHASAADEIDRADFDEDWEYEDAIEEMAMEMQNDDMDGLYSQVRDALTYSMDGNDEAVDQVMEAVGDQISEGSLDITDLDEAIRESGAEVYDHADEMMSAGGVSAAVLQKLGYEGVVDHKVNTKFGSDRQYGTGMEGMDPDTSHAIAFPGGEQNMRSVNAQYDPDKRTSTNMLASRLLPTATAAAAGTGALVAPEESEAGVTRFVRGAGGLLAPESKRIATRYPTAVKRTEDPLREALVIDTDSMLQAGTLQQNMTETLKNPQFKSSLVDPSMQAEDVRGQMVDNLLQLHDEFDPELRDQAKLWYDGANRIANQFSQKYNVPPEGAAAALAALSPQKDWYKNVSLAERAMDVMQNNKGVWTDEAKETAKRIYPGEKYAADLEASQTLPWEELTNTQKAMQVRSFDEAHNPQHHRIITPGGEFADFRTKKDGGKAGTGWGSNVEIGKAIAVLENPTMDNISAQMGGAHKVRNFYNNIIEPNADFGDVTIDTHAVAADMYSPFSGNSEAVKQNFGTQKGIKNDTAIGAKGTYGLHADAYRDAAQQAGILPREMQSITWEAARGLFPDTYKSVNKAENPKHINKIWEEYKAGHRSLEDTRSAIHEHAGGVNNPTWYTPGSDIRSFKGSADSSYKPELPTDRVPDSRGGSRLVAGASAGGAAGLGSQLTQAQVSGLLEQQNPWDQPPGSRLLTPGGMEHRIEPAANPWAGKLSEGIREGLDHVVPVARPFVPFAEALADWGEKGAYGENDWYDKWLVGADAF